MRRFVFVALLWCGAVCVFGQGGPPMLTDDPGTPGNGRWENNIAITFEHPPNEWSLQTPQVDLNYGWGDHIQLNAQTSFNILKRTDHGAIGGPGDAQLAVKWRFVDEDRRGFDMSIYPRLFVNLAQSSVRRGLTDAGTRFLLPAEIAKKIGRFECDAEVGALVGTVGPSEWLYGLVVGTELSEKTEVMAELHGTSRTSFADDELAVNFGFRHKLNAHAIWIGSLGHELRAPDDDPLALIGYCGVQLLY
ncbi:MAG: hypothetical protein ACJ8KU_08695 [Chthoniobacterales bacterium]